MAPSQLGMLLAIYTMISLACLVFGIATVERAREITGGHSWNLGEGKKYATKGLILMALCWAWPALAVWGISRLVMSAVEILRRED